MDAAREVAGRPRQRAPVGTPFLAPLRTGKLQRVLERYAATIADAPWLGAKW